MDLCPLCAGKKKNPLQLLRLNSSAVPIGTPFYTEVGPGLLLVLPSSKLECVFKLPSHSCRTVPCFNILSSENCTAECNFYRF